MGDNLIECAQTIEDRSTEVNLKNTKLLDSIASNGSHNLFLGFIYVRGFRRENMEAKSNLHDGINLEETTNSSIRNKNIAFQMFDYVLFPKTIHERKILENLSYLESAFIITVSIQEEIDICYEKKNDDISFMKGIDDNILYGIEKERRVIVSVNVINDTFDSILHNQHLRSRISQTKFCAVIQYLQMKIYDEYVNTCIYLEDKRENRQDQKRPEKQNIDANKVNATQLEQKTVKSIQDRGDIKLYKETLVNEEKEISTSISNSSSFTIEKNGKVLFKLKGAMEALKSPEVVYPAERESRILNKNITNKNTGKRKINLTLEGQAADDLNHIISFLDANSLRNLCQSCKLMYKYCFHVVPGLTCTLLPHQRTCLGWMLQRESSTKINFPKLVGGNSDASLFVGEAENVDFKGKKEKGAGTKISITSVMLDRNIFLDLATGAFSRLEKKTIEGSKQSIEYFYSANHFEDSVQGGILADEPGLGKTVTMLALILKTKGLRGKSNSNLVQTVSQQDVIHDSQNCMNTKKTKEEILTEIIAKAESDARKSIDKTVHNNIYSPDLKFSLGEKSLRCQKRRSIDPNELKHFGGTLIIVPSALIIHWEEQFQRHVDSRLGLKVYIDHYRSGKNKDDANVNHERISQENYQYLHQRPNSHERIDRGFQNSIMIDSNLLLHTKILPEPEILSHYDVVITSMERLTNDWNSRKKPESSREAGSFRRYGYEESSDDEPSMEMQSNKKFKKGTLSRKELKKKMSPLLDVYWLRLVIDEGHSLGSVVSTSAGQMATCLEAQRRWIMTGTPIKGNVTLKTNDKGKERDGLNQIRSLFKFLREPIFGNIDSTTWDTLLSRPYINEHPMGLYFLMRLLSTFSIRHSKEMLLKTLPKPKFVEHYIRPSLYEKTAYDNIAAMAMTNLFITDVKGGTHGHGSSHPDSILHSSNRKFLMEMLYTLRTSCCGGGDHIVTITSKTISETLDMVRQYPPYKDQLSSGNFNKYNDAIASIGGYLNRSFNSQASRCNICNIDLYILVIFPCGHYICSQCMYTAQTLSPVQDDALRSSCTQSTESTGEYGMVCCPICRIHVQVDYFQRLQPGVSIEYDLSKPIDIGNEGNVSTLLSSTLVNSNATLNNSVNSLSFHNNTVTSNNNANSLSFHNNTSSAAILSDDQKEVSTAWREENQVEEEESWNLVSKLKKLVSRLEEEKEKLQNIKKRVLVRHRYDTSNENKDSLNQQMKSSIRPLKVIVFSQFRPFLYSLEGALIQLGWNVASFSNRSLTHQSDTNNNPFDNNRLNNVSNHRSTNVRIRELDRFRYDPDVNILLLSREGSHGLDLSFVTHIFLMEEIKDKALEEQVISRAHRMGADTSRSLLVERFVMEGTMEEIIRRNYNSPLLSKGDYSSSTKANMEPFSADDSEQEKDFCEGKGASIGIGVEINWEKEVAKESAASIPDSQKRKSRKRKYAENKNRKKVLASGGSSSGVFGNLRNQDLIRKIRFLRWNQDLFFHGVVSQRKRYAKFLEDMKNEGRTKIILEKQEKKAVTWDL